MKVVHSLVILSLIVLTFGAFQPASAAAFSYTSAYQIFNLQNTDAAVTIVFYNQDGSVKSQISTSVAASDTETYFVISQLTGDFNGSVVIGSTTEVASIVNVHGAKNGNTYFANASYIAQSKGGTTVQIPLLMKNNSGYSTWFNVQNAAGTGNATVDVVYSDGTHVDDVQIPNGSAHTFDQATETHSAAVFAATVTSDRDVVVTVIEESANVMFAYNGGIGTSTTNPVIPIVNTNNSGYTTSINIKNDGGQATAVTVSYTPSAGNNTGAACTETQTIDAGKVKTFALAAFANGANSNCAAGNRFVGSAKVTGNSTNQNLSAIVNQHKLGVDGSAYTAFNPAQATSRVIFPLIMDRNSNWWTGLNVQNVGTQKTTVTCTFNNTTFKAGPEELDPGEALNVLTYGVIANKYVGSATCVAAGGDEKIVGIVNESQVGGTSDQLMTYEGINLANQ